ncbi:hypothetical protein BN14_04424 [Rhizoctonia solani AG-1 IB]|uniref:Uncharacterized protein n=1 Tax=Thanatephorus cucumeris (strain AG1-IB / isolate 7/3/14) TaxID=1108050 RepID=M5BV35_THACB|nr:hypothetical protein BN14_04424 [Rhizoctonia solani AG-1 IB]
MHRPGFALTAPSTLGHPPPPSSAPALSHGMFNGYFPPGTMGMGLSKRSSERGQQRPQMHTHHNNPYGYLAAPGPASAPPGPPPHMVGYPPYGGYQPYNPYGFPGMAAPAYPYPPPQIMPAMPAMPLVPAGPPSAISENLGMVVRAPRLVRPKEDEQPPMRWEPGKDYAPVLDPFTLGILNPKVELHPLLHPPNGGVTNRTLGVQYVIPAICYPLVIRSSNQVMVQRAFLDGYFSSSEAGTYCMPITPLAHGGHK